MSELEMCSREEWLGSAGRRSRVEVWTGSVYVVSDVGKRDDVK